MNLLADAFAREWHDIVVVAKYFPGFSSSPGWKLTLEQKGLLIQTVDNSENVNALPNGKRRFEVEVGIEFVASVLQRANDLDFWRLDAVDPDVIVTDLPSLSLAIRNREKSRTYSPDSVTYHAHHGHEGAKHFLELWDLIHCHAPFPPKG